MPRTAARSPFRSRHRRSASAPTLEAVAARVDADTVTVVLADGRVVSVPLAWSARLLRGTPAERAEVEVSPYGVHWPQLDEGFSVEGMLAGRPSTETAASLAEWHTHMERRRAQVAHGGEPEPYVEALPLPDWWDDDKEDEPSASVPHNA